MENEQLDLHVKLKTGKEAMDEMLGEKITEIMEFIKRQTEFGDPTTETIGLTNQLQSMVATQIAFREATKEAEEALAAAEKVFVTTIQNAISDAKNTVEADPETIVASLAADSNESELEPANIDEDDIHIDLSGADFSDVVEETAEASGSNVVSIHEGEDAVNVDADLDAIADQAVNGSGKKGGFMSFGKKA